MTGCDDVEDDDEARNICVIRIDHQADEPVSPQQNAGKDGEPGKDHPKQQGLSFRTILAG
jgi:hypothetical protein